MACGHVEQSEPKYGVWTYGDALFFGLSGGLITTWYLVCITMPPPRISWLAKEAEQLTFSSFSMFV